MTCYYANLDHEALLHVQGPDALSFLQGQVTCDTRSLRADLALPGACCTVQGRVVFDFLLGQLEADHLVLRMRRDILASSAALAWSVSPHNRGKRVGTPPWVSQPW